NLNLIGNSSSYSGSDDSGILLGETKNSVIDNVYIESFDYGITLRNSSNTIIKYNHITSTSKACIKTTYGNSYSGTISNSSSNYNAISFNYLNSLTGSTAPIIVEGGEGTSIVSNVITGDVSGLGTNAIYFDNLSASNINWCNISNNSIKNVTDSGGAYLYIKSRTGIYDVKNLSCSNAGLFVEVETQTGNPEIKIQDTGEMINNTRLKSDANARWIIQDNKLPTSLNITSESELRTNVDGSNKTLWYSGCRSTTSVLIATGATSFTIPLNMDGYDVGNVIKIEYTTDPTQYMTGTVTSYNSATGALVVNVTVTAGAGTYNNWTIYTENSTPPATNIIYRGSNGQGG
ncbi:MAG TPA: right-handed parallel beta-helix repeat-containing protein, partial [Bacteroidales bacterium]|nr:right-handed parallel beta-helix repeat-containing protein [Bacteroidales bacterium]